MAEPGHEPEADLRSSPPPWNATAVAPDAFDALLTQLASVHRVELGRASEAAKRLSKEIEELSKEIRILKNSVAAGSGGCGSSGMETSKVPADSNKNNSPMEQQAEKQDAFSKERGEQDKKIDEMMLEIDINMELERQESKEKGHDGQTGKVLADTSPMEQQAGEQDAISNERVEQDKKVDEMGLKIDINMQSERQEKGHDGQIKVDELKDLLGVSDGLAPEDHTVFAPRSDLSFGFIGVMPAGPGSHQRESPYLAIPGVIVKPPNVPLTRGNFSENLEVQTKMVSKETSMSMLEPVVDAYKTVALSPRRRASEGCIAPNFSNLAAWGSKSHSGRRSSNLSVPMGSEKSIGSVRSVHSALSCSAYLGRATSRPDLPSDGDAFDRQLMGLHPVWKNQAQIFGTQQLHWAQSTFKTGTIINDQSSTRGGSRRLQRQQRARFRWAGQHCEEQDHHLYAYLWGRQAWEVLGLLMISLDLVAVPL
ncbi:unnamed protein product, partial [Polarella glacialis]